VNDTITFDASASYDPDGSILFYVWDFGDGNNVTKQNPTHTYSYTQEGSYAVTLTVIDNDELSDKTIIGITDVVIPEFPSWIILPLFFAVTFSVLLLKKRLISKT
jgi:PKD repeat protein